MITPVYNKNNDAQKAKWKMTAVEYCNDDIGPPSLFPPPRPCGDGQIHHLKGGLSRIMVWVVVVGGGGTCCTWPCCHCHLRILTNV
jgi:hypothetical protein